MKNPLDGVDVSKLMEAISAKPIVPRFNFEVPAMPQIDPKSTVQYRIDEQTKILREQGEQQLKALIEQNKQLCELVKQRDKELQDNKSALAASEKNNKDMKIITLIACAAAVISAALTALIGFGVI